MVKRLVLFGCLALASTACGKHKDKAGPGTKAPPSAAAQAGPVKRVEKPLAKGDPAPALDAVAHTGERVKLQSYRGRPVVLYFYPKDDSPGCTKEAIGLRDALPQLRKDNAVVFGVSADDNVSHRAFASKLGLSYLLLPDTDHKIARTYGVPVKNGRDMRYTFIIDKDGKIASVIPNVDPTTNAKLVLDELGKLAG